MPTAQFHINIDSIRQHTDARVYGLGEECAAAGVVLRVTQRGNLLLGLVTGDTLDPYEVVIHLQDGEPIAATCTCPFDWGDWCQHKVAVALFAANSPGSVIVKQDLPELLATFATRQDLADLIAHLVDHRPGLMETIDTYSVSHEPAHAGSAQVDPTPEPVIIVDLSKIYAKVSAQLDSQPDPNSAAQPIFATALDFAYAGDAVNALYLLAAVADKLSDDAWSSYNDHVSVERGRGGYRDRYYASYDDDYDEYLELDEFKALDQLDGVWAEACLALSIQDALSPDDAEMVNNAAEGVESVVTEMDEEVVGEGWTGFYLVYIALKEGWDVPNFQRLLSGAIKKSGDWDEIASDYADNLIDVRLRVLDRTQRHDEYLILAEVKDRQISLARMLARIGRMKEAQTLALALATLPNMALSLAQGLSIDGFPTLALKVAEAGLDVGVSSGTNPVARWLIGAAKEAGNQELAIKAAVIALLSLPTLTNYHRLREVAGEQWSLLQPDVLARLRQVKVDYYGQLVDIFLEENSVQDAVNAAPSHITLDMAQRLFPPAMKVDPAWVIAQAGKYADLIISSGKASKYDEAIKWLRFVRDTYRQAGQETMWADNLAAIRTAHSGKYKLMRLLGQLG